ncbi:hypothetical protein M758_UG028100 [Ceratodon purpureus]|nr:hypothetical protein M758_UG028100 [Ceratodon purpureus]
MEAARLQREKTDSTFKGETRSSGSIAKFEGRLIIAPMLYLVLLRLFLFHMCCVLSRWARFETHFCIQNFKCLIVDDRWRIKVDEMGHIDPFGSDVVHGAICHSLLGAAYSSDIIVELTLEQLAFSSMVWSVPCMMKDWIFTRQISSGR